MRFSEEFGTQFSSIVEAKRITIALSAFKLFVIFVNCTLR